ncbi:MAG: 2-oxoglutarate and iron-dependent oxygenase domain-containing protein [Pseudomonadota bacterium]|nr:2-oxoglutarate and iron-dependent oxygenase domain-containing protein [Pseudomonadota bacterium]
MIGLGLTQQPADDDVIPVIDFGPFRTGGNAARTGVARAIDDAARSIGFLVIEGHGIPADLVQAAFGISREFFAQPVGTKMLAAPPDSTIPRGYQAFATKRLAATLGIETPPDLREQFFMGPPDARPGMVEQHPAAARFYADNIWPAAPAGFRETMTALYRAYERLGAELMAAFAIAIDLPEDHFAGRIDRHFSTGTTNLYPALSVPPLEGQMRTGMHTDFGSLTLLLRTESPGGLQVRDDDGAWHDVPDLPGTVVVNIGDMMARWSNDRWRSTLHRVANPPTVDGTLPARQSMGYFLHPNFDTVVEALPGCVDADHPALYPPVLAGDHMREKLVKRVA